MLSHFHKILFFSLILLYSSGALNAVYAAAACGSLEGYYFPNGEDYRGHVNITESGIPCQRWSEQEPHPHDTRVPNPLTGVGDHNYCRNPSGLERPGCFTVNPSVRYQFCNVGPLCDWTPPKKILQFEPPSGTHLKADQPVVITCYPRPCQIYYTLDGSQPTTTTTTTTTGSAILYSRPVVLSRNTTVKALAVFVLNKTLRSQSFYSLPTPPAPIGVYFAPLPSEVSHGPVLVVVKGLKKSDTVLVFKNQDFHGVPYEGPFWLGEGANLTAVINGEHMIHTSYAFPTIEAHVEMYPSSGKYIGGVSCLVFQSQTKAKYEISMNNSEWQPLSKFSFLLENYGTNLVGIRMTYMGGVVGTVWRTYEIVEALPPVLSPAPDIYTRPIQVTCTDPLGRVLDLDKNNEGELIYFMNFDTPGHFSVQCSYVDDINKKRSISVLYKLQSVPLPMPLLQPECGRRFPMIPILLMATIVPPLGMEDNEKDLSRLTLFASSTTGATLKNLLGNHSYLLEANQTKPINVSITLLTHSSYQMEADSPPLACQYELLPLGSSVTPFIVGRPSNCHADHRLDCVESLLRQLATCLSFATTELIYSLMIGPFLMIQLQRLPTSMRMEYYERTGECLFGTSLNDIRNETSESIKLARQWTVNKASPSFDIVTNSKIIITVEGWGLDSFEFHLVREEFSCDDIGVSYLERNSLNYFSLQLLFILDIPGNYRLCASLNDALYPVPSDGPLIVIPSPLAVLHPLPCGGRLDADEDVTVNVLPQGLNPFFFVSIDTGVWHREVVGTVLHIPPITTSSTLALNAGLHSEASRVCVFYAPQNDTSMRVTYKWTVISIQEDKKNILLAVNGTFSSEARVELLVFMRPRETTLTQHERLTETPFFMSLGTVIGNFVVADKILTLVGGVDEYPVASVVVSVDGTLLDVEPLNIALSPLATVMRSCKNCTSGRCLQDQCVCIGETNRTAYICEEKTRSPIPVDFISTRVLLVMGYFLLLAAVGVSVGVAIYYGTVRNARRQECQTVTVEG